MQQGGRPSPFDRNMATKMAAKAYHWFEDQLKATADADGKVNAVDKTSACLLGMRTRHYQVSFGVWWISFGARCRFPPSSSCDI